jgi:hypothetical protein
MGYLNQQVVTVDAILTKKGREALARGTFLPTQFALSDDEIDYTMFNPNHPSGSAFYGEAIEGMPLLEAFPDETQIMKYKLLTLPRGTARLPVLDLGFNSITLKQGSSLALTPQTLNYLGSDTSEPGGYSTTISDVRILSSFEGVGVQSSQPISLDTVGTSVSRTVVGTTINIKATTLNTLFTSKTQLQSTITVVGRDSGARITIPITITKAS